MSEKDFNTIFSKRLRFFLNKYEMTQNELAKRLGVGTTSVYNWCNGIKTPRMDKVDAMCNIFNCRRSELMEEKSDTDEHLNPKDRKDISAILANTEELLQQDGLMFDGEPASQESIDSILSAMKIGMELAKQKNKEKYTPKKYKKD